MSPRVDVSGLVPRVRPARGAAAVRTLHAEDPSARPAAVHGKVVARQSLLRPSAARRTTWMVGHASLGGEEKYGKDISSLEKKNTSVNHRIRMTTPKNRHASAWTRSIFPFNRIRMTIAPQPSSLEERKPQRCDCASGVNGCGSPSSFLHFPLDSRMAGPDVHAMVNGPPGFLHFPAGSCMTGPVVAAGANRRGRPRPGGRERDVDDPRPIGYTTCVEGLGWE